ncbi:alkaline phosphatase synthesis sensor protein PhoR [Clostridium acetireducens DSM 10703]|uniref:histidine kinase n=1 Tax=Clostridium acetireducens DSM 10703 TaxID=1121290 RepID=A0A1E8EVV0_9CLOT|nr:HAMP domain-containing sensor histidine kinase [Clostridium acetireducens]OFI01382.1 alkaline phosphatase synthesis sensor protein PhoR [Clostridium acetireducens DSM 10703]
MIQCIKTEPLFKKMLALLLSSLVFITLMFLCVQYYFLNEIHKSQIELNQNMVGKLVNIYPEKEIDIVKNVLNKRDKSFTKSGENILIKYGYDKHTNAFEDDIFQKHIYKFIGYSLVFFVIIIGINLLLFIYGINHFEKRLEVFSKALDNIMDGNFSNDIFENEEGLIARLKTQFQQMERRLQLSIENLEKEKESIKSLVTDISHQLKTPIASIKLFNSILLEDDVTYEENREFLNRIKVDVNNLEWLVSSLIKISRLEIGIIQIKMEQENIKETIIKAVNAVQAKANEKNICVTIENIRDCYIYHDIKWTKEAIFNVLENGVKYTEKGGQVSISMIEMESCIRIDIKDNGIGIPEDDVNNIFKRFYRGSLSKVKESEGSGIGLYLTRKIFENQGGSIIVSSSNEKGTEFSLFLQKCYKS